MTYNHNELDLHQRVGASKPQNVVTESREEIAQKTEEIRGERLTTNLISIVGNIESTQQILTTVVVLAYVMLIVLVAVFAVSKVYRKYDESANLQQV